MDEKDQYLNHTFIHFLKSGQRLTMNLIREKGKMPQIKMGDDVRYEDLFMDEQSEFIIWESICRASAMKLITEEEINMLANYAKQMMNKKT